MDSNKTLMSKQSTVRSSPKFSFRGKPEEKPPKAGKDMPGPGKYGCPSVSQKYVRSASYAFGTSQREFAKSTNPKRAMPGPGTYVPTDPNDSSLKYGFGSADRMPRKKPGCGPPPGTYNLGSTLGGKSVTIISKREGKRSASLPGPGAYKPDDKPCREALPMYGFGSESRDGFFAKDNRMPGPGKYELMKELGGNICVPTSPSFSMKSRRRPLRADSTPGPIFAPYSQFD